jgi:hydroxypyruvate isomerase
MTTFSANLGLLWKELALPRAIEAAAAAGFDAVECHSPYATPVERTNQALESAGIKMLGLNTSRGMAGESGLAALPGRETEARDSIDTAIEYAAATKTANVHVMAGIGQGQLAEEAFVANLTYACEAAAPYGIGILIEPLNAYDAPGYFLRRTTHAESIIATVGQPNLKLLFDCYHVQMTEGDVSRRLEWLLPIIGHIQFAGVPNRGEPDQGELNYAHIFKVIAGLGWRKPLGAEYKPLGDIESGLGWMQTLG